MWLLVVLSLLAFGGWRGGGGGGGLELSCAWSTREQLRRRAVRRALVSFASDVYGDGGAKQWTIRTSIVCCVEVLSFGFAMGPLWLELVVVFVVLGGTPTPFASLRSLSTTFTPQYNPSSSVLDPSHHTSRTVPTPHSHHTHLSSGSGHILLPVTGGTSRAGGELKWIPPGYQEQQQQQHTAATAAA